jgi:subtilisin family serine protease
LLIYSFLILWAAASPAWGRNVPDEVIVRFKPGTTGAAATRAIDELGGRERDELRGLGFKRITLPPGLTPEVAAERLKHRSDVESAAPNPLVKAFALPNDPRLPSFQWHLYKIHATDAWIANVSGNQGAASIIIAVIDSGLFATHEEFPASKVVPGHNAINPALPTTDECGHGTWVSGIAAAATNNLAGGAGVAWLPRIMPVKAIAYDATIGDCVGSDFDIDQAVLWASSNGARVINMSLGGSTRTDAEAATMEAAWSRGCVLVAAAGNEASSNPSYPAAYADVVGVSATDQNDLLASFSNFGTYVDVAAPGVGIDAPDTAATNAYASVSGTSMASPIVAGLAAVLLGQDPSRTNEDIVRLLEQSADQLEGYTPGERNAKFGYGRVNMVRALTGNLTPPPSIKDNGYAFPNPFSPTIDRYVTFVIKAPGGQAVSVEVFDVVGNLVWRKRLDAGATTGADLYYNSPMRWDGRDTAGRDMANGVYTAVITVGTSRTIKKIVVAR